MGKRTIVNSDDCIGCGMCEAACPEVFKLEDNISTVIKPLGGNEDAIKTAAWHCPQNCITLDETRS